jgi:hypothetical protein
MSCISSVAKRYGVIALLAVLLWSVLAPSGSAQTFERVPVVLDAREVLPRELLTGANYTVRNLVMSDGLINTYDVDTFYGPLKVESTALLLKRIGELKAISRIEQLKGTDTYTNALKQAAMAPVKTAEGLVTDPGGTVSGVVTGIGRFFSNVEQSVTSTDPDQPGAAQALSGQAAYKRQFAYQFGVDPYSSFAPLQKALDDVSWTAAAGSLTVKAAMMAIPGGAGTVIGFGGTADSLKQLVSEKTPADLDKMNRDRLRDMGVTDYVAQEFLTNTSYDPQEKTLLVGALWNMAGVTSPGIYIQKAASAHEEPVVLYMRVMAQLMEVYNEKYGPVARFVDAGGTPLLMTKGGKVVGVFPLDYIVWTAWLASKEAGISKTVGALPGTTAKELWFTGKVDASARKALEKRGWKVEDNVQEKFLRNLSY